MPLEAPILKSPPPSEKIVRDILALADVKINGSRPWDIKVHNQAFYKRVLAEGDIGFGESYMEEWWDTDALDECLFRILRTDIQNSIKPNWKDRWCVLKAKMLNLQNKPRCLKVIKEHYQLGNDLFENMLDETMTYSCGYWKTSSTLADAQRAKFDLIARKMELKRGMKILDIGCGWGGFAKHVAEQYGVQVIGITLSENQAFYAKKICQSLPIEIRVQDYRDVNEIFDRIISIGMFEHVGAKNYRTLMNKVNACLKDDGLFLLHTIGSQITKITGNTWTTRYIFPHGQLPSICQIGQSIEKLFIVEDWHNFGADYDLTLMAWFENFDKNWGKIKSKYPNHFYRMWKFYLLGAAGNFRSRLDQLWQIVLSKNGILNGYTSAR